MGAKKTPMATTLTIGEGYSRLVEHPDYLDQPLYQASYSPAEIEELRSKTLPAWKERGWTWWMMMMTPVAQEHMSMIDAAGGITPISQERTVAASGRRGRE